MIMLNSIGVCMSIRFRYLELSNCLVICIDHLTKQLLNLVVVALLDEV